MILLMEEMQKTTQIVLSYSASVPVSARPRSALHPPLSLLPSIQRASIAVRASTSTCTQPLSFYLFGDSIAWCLNMDLL